jgi:hypothetical protein
VQRAKRTPNASPCLREEAKQGDRKNGVAHQMGLAQEVFRGLVIAWKIRGVLAAVRADQTVHGDLRVKNHRIHRVKVRGLSSLPTPRRSCPRTDARPTFHLIFVSSWRPAKRPSI